MNQKKQLIVLVVLLLTAGFIWFLYFNNSKPVVTADARPATQNYQPIGVDNPQLHKDGVEKARKTEYKSSGRNIFSRELPPPPPNKNPKLDPVPSVPKVDIPPPPPTVAPLPAKFFGFGTIPNGTARVAFLSGGEGDIYVLKEGELLLSRFRILRIGNTSLEYEEVSTGLRGTAPLVEEQAAPQ
jgi:hypothetical protein